MITYTRKEFIESCGHQWNDASRAKISMWVKRGNIIELDGKIDISHPQNKDWLLKKRAETETPEPAPMNSGRRPDQLNELEVDFWQFTDQGVYHVESEKLLAGLMKQVQTSCTPMRAIPVDLAHNLSAGAVVEVINVLLTREIALRAQYGMGTSRAEKSKLLKEFTEIAREHIDGCRREMEETIDGILEDHGNSGN
ncbi:hypothetical protein KK083_15260 [Fulvivirgaceae bacterium PWU4]|uniref:Uncharacterized protein n=1 Tax=Chryseosolibacter histidini TaxID=2782349 RepID=A0AAP2DKY4_9BACT|nr:hypothetical protein [Chryseosolibacter histidini]MBT1698250.1 hypothetical protein [Chryseosolibacter histidini]